MLDHQSLIRGAKFALRSPARGRLCPSFSPSRIGIS